MQGIELEAVQVEFDGTPRVGGDALMEVVGELVWRQVVDLPIKVLTHRTNGSGVGVDGFGL